MFARYLEICRFDSDVFELILEVCCCAGLFNINCFTMSLPRNSEKYDADRRTWLVLIRLCFSLLCVLWRLRHIECHHGRLEGMVQACVVCLRPKRLPIVCWTCSNFSEDTPLRNLGKAWQIPTRSVFSSSGLGAHFQWFPGLIP